MKTNPEMTPGEVSGVIVQEYGASYPEEWYFITQTCVDLGRMDQIKNALDVLAGLLIEQRPWTSVERAAKEAWNAYYVPHRDLYHFAELLHSYYGDPEVRAACDTLMQAISRAVVHNYHSPLEENANGLAIFFPTVQNQYNVSYDWVNNIELSVDTRWDEFLRLFVSRGFTSPDTYERNDTLSQAYGPLLPQTNYSSYISFSEDKDFYFVVTGRQTDLSLILTSPNGIDYDLAVFDVNGTPLGSSLLDGEVDSLFLADLQAGTYYIEVLSNGNFSEVPYSLTTDYSGAGTGQVPIFYDDSVPDSSLFSAIAEDVIGSRMHAPEYPMMLDEVSFYIQNRDGAGTGGDGSFYVYLADYFGTVFEPFRVTPGGYRARGISRDIGWFSVDLSDRGIRLQSDFFVGVGYDGQNTPALGMDPEDNGGTYQWDAATKRWRSLTATAFVRARASYLASPGRVSVSIASGIEGPRGQTVTVPVSIETVPDPGADSLELVMTFDPEVLTFSGLNTDNTLTAWWHIDKLNHAVAGKVEISLHGDNPLTGPGTALAIRFQVSPSAVVGDTSEVFLERVLLGKGAYSVETQSGSIVVISPSGVQEHELGNMPTEFALSQNVPNPFNPVTSIRYALPERQHVRLSVYNTLGQEIAILVEGDHQAGFHEVMWDAGEYSAGVYFCRLETEGFTRINKMLFVK